MVEADPNAVMIKGTNIIILYDVMYSVYEHMCVYNYVCYDYMCLYVCLYVYVFVCMCVC